MKFFSNKPIVCIRHGIFRSSHFSNMSTTVQQNFFVAMIDAISCPLNITLFLICALLVYLSLRPLLRKKKTKTIQVPKMGKRDFTLEELQKFDGKGEHKRILIAVNGKIFDVTNNGQEFYGKGAPYAVFAGKDASRALACFNLETKNEYDDLSDLTPDQMKTLREWELQFSERYDHIGRLLKPGEPHRVYEINDGEDEVGGTNHIVQRSCKEKIT